MRTSNTVTSFRARFQRRLIALTAAGLLIAQVAGGQRTESEPKATDFARFDAVLQRFLASNGVTAAVAAIGRDGTLLHEGAFGFSDAAGRTPLTANARFRIASVTKPVTAAVVGELARAGRLSRNDRVEASFPCPPWSAAADPRWREVTIQQVLEHRGGWNRAASGDPMFRTGEARAWLGHDPAGPVDIVRWVRTLPLDFAPGSTSAYANVGYCVLGRVIEAASGTNYFANVRDLIAVPCGIRSWSLAEPGPGRQADEVWYDFGREDERFDLRLMDAHGGLISTAADLCRFMGRFTLAGERRSAQRGARYVFFGSLPGTTAIAVERADGLDYAVLLNKRDPAAKWHERLQNLLDLTLDANR
jgi:CubicO group peptidase (beta-lactamase class C family)